MLTFNLQLYNREFKVTRETFVGVEQIIMYMCLKMLKEDNLGDTFM